MNRPVSPVPEAMRSWPGPWQLVQFWAVASYTPLSVWAASSEGASFSTAILFGLVVMVVAMVAVRLLAQLRLDMASSSNSVAAVVLLLSTSGSLIERFPLGRLGLLILAFVVAVIVYRISQLAVVGFAFTWVVLALVALPWVGLVGNEVDEQGLTLDISDGSYSVEGKGDVVVVVFDAYAGSSTLQREFGFDNSAIVAELVGIGATVYEDIPANYSHTTVSVPSVLQLEYVTGEGTLTSSDIDALQAIVGGSNVFSRSLRDSGYESVYVESGWLGTKCSDEVDTCVGGPWPGETFFDIIHRTILRDAPGLETGVLFSRGAMNALDWSREELPVRLANERNEYIYIHLLMPHPPFFLDGACNERVDALGGGFTLSWPGMSAQHLAQRRDRYVEQVQCANAIMEDLARVAADTGSTLVMFGDHGPDGHNQLFSAAVDWDEEMIAERLGTFAAVYSPGCRPPDASSLVMIGPIVLSCLGGEAPEETEDRFYIIERPQDSIVVVESRPPRS